MPRRDLWTTVSAVDNETQSSAPDGIVPAMRGLWRRRPVRHLVVCLAPLLVLGAVLIALLGVRFTAALRPLQQATADATGTVTRSGLGDGDELELRWTDGQGVQHTNIIRVPGIREVPKTVPLRYVPSDPSRVYVGGDATYVRLRNLFYDAFLVVVVLLIVLAVSVVHVLRRLAAERRTAHTLPTTHAQSRRGLIHRSWLLLNEADREWWVPVHWEPVLGSTLAKTPCKVHGRPLADRVLVVDVHGTSVWQSGRKRPVSPRGDVITAATPWSKAAQRRADEADLPPPAGLLRQFRADAALLAAAPLLGLIWSYLDTSGTAGFVGGTLLMAGVLFWLPSIIGSDPV
jgi:hypothetical protein